MCFPASGWVYNKLANVDPLVTTGWKVVDTYCEILQTIIPPFAAGAGIIAVGLWVMIVLTDRLNTEPNRNLPSFRSDRSEQKGP